VHLDNWGLEGAPLVPWCSLRHYHRCAAVAVQAAQAVQATMLMANEPDTET